MTVQSEDPSISRTRTKSSIISGVFSSKEDTSDTLNDKSTVRYFSPKPTHEPKYEPKYNQ